MNTDKDGRIEEFEEKPANPKSNLASMGIYIFNKNFLKKYLEDDAKDETSSHDFGKNIIPKMLADKARLYSYAFDGYWKDVGTIESLWQANMDLLQDVPPFELNGDWKIYSSNPSMPPHFVGPDTKIKNSMVSEGSMILGEVENSVIFPGVRIGKGAKITNSVVMPSTVIRENAVVDYAIIAQNCEIAEGAKVAGEKGAITVVAEGETVESEAGSKQAG
jgi:glucose-1-phosphate adenylyltransferase